eukprot:8966301-Lingulodinium_polyedra.AAC.1
MKRRSQFWGGGGKRQRPASVAVVGGLAGQAAGRKNPFVDVGNRGFCDGDDVVDVLVDLWGVRVSEC